MDNASLEQHRFLSKYKYEIADNGILVTEKKILGLNRFKVPFENISVEVTEVTLSSKFWFVAMIILLSLAVIVGFLKLFGQDVESYAFLEWGIPGVIAALIFFATRSTVQVYGSITPRLIVHKDKPNPETFAAFMRELQLRKRDYLMKNYVLDSNGRYTTNAVDRLASLKKNRVITEEEFEILKSNAIKNMPQGGPLPFSNN